MRVSDQGRHGNQLRHLQEVTARLDRIQEQLATGQQVRRPSDDPAGVAASLGYRADIAFETQMRRNIESGLAFLNAGETALDGATEALQRLRELAVQAANGTLGAVERQAIAREVDQLTRHLVQLGNTNFGGAYVFSGHRTTTPAFAVTGEPPASVAYAGDAGLRERQVAEAEVVAVNIPGDVVFGSLFNDLIALREALDANGPTSAIQAGLAAIDAGLDRVIGARAELGARVNRLEATRSLSETTDITLQELRADIEEVDLAEAIMQLNAQQNALQAAMGAIGMARQLSILDHL